MPKEERRHGALLTESRGRSSSKNDDDTNPLAGLISREDSISGVGMTRRQAKRHPHTHTAALISFSAATKFEEHNKLQNMKQFAMQRGPPLTGTLRQVTSPATTPPTPSPIPAMAHGKGLTHEEGGVTLCSEWDQRVEIQAEPLQ